jgi:hypothetical protein
LGSNHLLKHVIEGKKEGKIEVTGKEAEDVSSYLALRNGEEYPTNNKKKKY